MEWRKQGCLFAPSENLPQARSPGKKWMRSHAALPVADSIGGDDFAVYFSSRDERGRSQIGRLDLKIDLDQDTPARVQCVYPDPVIGLGPLGAFDDSGVTSACLVNYDGKKYQYYSGWSLGITVPFYFYIGLAVSEDSGRTFHKIFPAPVMPRSAVNPYLTASPFVMIEGGIWRMWYVSGVCWKIENGKPKHYYHIRYAESLEGIRWNDLYPVSVDFQSPEEYAIGRPCVRKESGIYRMWYCYRGQSYRIGYAESMDGISWVRKDEEAGMECSETGWDSQMQAYPWLFRHREALCMLYNGNSYGETGFGLAIAGPGE
jgi:hypothetical protein